MFELVRRGYQDRTSGCLPRQPLLNQRLLLTMLLVGRWSELVGTICPDSLEAVGINTAGEPWRV